MALIYIVEDDRNISEIESYALKNAGYETKEFYCAKDFYEGLKEQIPDLFLLDIMLPDEDGLQIVKELKLDKKTNMQPIILVTAKTTEIDKVKGLDIGADDYIVKPFSPNEVMARVRAVLRRMGRGEEEKEKKVLTVGDLTINIEAYTVFVGTEKIPMTKKEVETMWILAKNPSKVFTRDNLLDSLWGQDYFGDSRTVDSHIKRLRAKLDKVEHPDWEIKTIWGLGYKFELNV